MTETELIPVDPDKIAENIGKRLRMERSIRNLSQEKLAMMLGMTQGELSKMEHAKLGSGVMNLAKLVYVASVLKCSWEYLVTGKEGKDMTAPIVDFTLPGILERLPLNSPVFAPVKEFEEAIGDYPEGDKEDWRYRAQYCRLENNCVLIVTKRALVVDYKGTFHFYFDEPFEEEGDQYIADWDEGDDPAIYPVVMKVKTFVLHDEEIIGLSECYVADPCYVNDTETGLFKEISDYLDADTYEDYEMFVGVWGDICNKMRNDPLESELLTGNNINSAVVLHRSSGVRQEYRNHKLFSSMRKAIAQSVCEDIFGLEPDPNRWVEIAMLVAPSEEDEPSEAEGSKAYKNAVEIYEHYKMQKYAGETDEPYDEYYYRIPTAEQIRRFLKPWENDA